MTGAARTPHTRKGYRYRSDWQTPRWLFDRFHARYRYSIDAASNGRNAMLPTFWTPADDALMQDWTCHRVWCNPPYGRDIAAWVEKAHDGSEGLVTLLVPARVECSWWHDHVLYADVITFVEGRVHFVTPDNPKGSRPVFASALATFHEGPRRADVSPSIDTLITPAMRRIRKRRQASAAQLSVIA